MKKLYTVVVLIAVLIIGGIGYNILQANDQGDKQQEAQEDSNQVIQKLLDDKLQYILTKDDNGEITIELKNVSDKSFTLNYSSSQTYDFQLLKDGEVAYLWSASASFLTVMGDKTIEPGESEKYVIDTKELPVDLGEYEFRFYSVAKELQDEPKGTIKIDIKVSNQSPLDDSVQ